MPVLGGSEHQVSAMRKLFLHFQWERVLLIVDVNDLWSTGMAQTLLEQATVNGNLQVAIVGVDFGAQTNISIAMALANP